MTDNTDPQHNLIPTDDDMLVIPLAAETLEVGKQQIIKGRVRLHKTVETETVAIDEPGYVQRVDVQHVPVERLIDAPPAIRHEGETLIIPVVQEVIVIEKRLMLVEEVHVTRRTIATHTPQTVELRREVLHVERLAGDGSSDPA